MRLLLCLFVSLPLFADAWIGWKFPTDSNRTQIRDNRVCVSSGSLLAAVHMTGDVVNDIRLIDPICEPDLQGLKVQLRTMTPEASVEWLASHVRTADDPSELVTAIALHEHASVVPVLIRFARQDPARQVRRNAIFWLGQKAGEKAAAELRHAVDHDPDDDVKQHAVFAISQLPASRGVPMLIELVKTHKSRKVRERAMFWLAQTEDPRALDLIEEILR